MSFSFGRESELYFGNKRRIFIIRIVFGEGREGVSGCEDIWGLFWWVRC